MQNILVYYKHLRCLCELINKEINEKGKQQKFSSFFKSVRMSNVDSEGVP